MQQTFDMFYEHQSKTISEKNRDENYKQILNDTDHLSLTQQIVYNAIIVSPTPLSDKEIHEHTGLPVSSVCARRNELVKLGKVIADEQPITRPDYRNQMRTVTGWRAIL